MRGLWREVLFVVLFFGWVFFVLVPLDRVQCGYDSLVASGEIAKRDVPFLFRRSPLSGE